MKIFFFDLETTGLPVSWKESYKNQSNWPYIVQLAYIISYNDYEMTESKDLILRPEGFSISSKSEDVHGISYAEALEVGYNRVKVLESFASILSDANYVVAHNINFDLNVLRCEFLRNNIEDPFVRKDLYTICTMKESTNFCKIPSEYGGYKWPSLQELHHELFDEYFEKAHDAKHDVKATFDCFWLLNDLEIVSISNHELIHNPLSQKQIHLQKIVSKNYNTFISLISFFYPFKKHDLINYKDFLDWNYVSRNQNIKWTVEIINELKDEIIFSKEYCASGSNYVDIYNEGLNYNPSIANNLDIIERFSEEWEDFTVLFNVYESKSLYYILNNYHTKLNFDQLSYQSIKWPKIALRDFKNSFNWYYLSENSILDEDIILEFEDLINWDKLSGNDNTNFTIDLINSYRDRWNWSKLSENKKARYNESLLNFKHLFDWEILSRDYPFTSDQLLEFIDYLDWQILSREYAFVSEQLVIFEDYINWHYIHLNSNINWNVDMIEKFKHRLEIYDLNLINSFWDVNLIEKYNSYLINNKNKEQKYFEDNIPISWDDLSKGSVSYYKLKISYNNIIIKRYEEYWDWESLHFNTNINWTIKMIRDFKDKLNFNLLSRSESVEWSNELIFEFFDYWNINSLLNNEAISFSKHLEGEYGSVNKFLNSEQQIIDENIYQFEKAIESSIYFEHKSFEKTLFYHVKSLLTKSFLSKLIKDTTYN